VANLTPLPTALKNSKPAAVHQNLMFDLDNPDWGIFDTFHDKLKDAIKRSPEFAQAAGHSSGQTPAGGFDDMEDSAF
jgi:hypothetical protein